MGSECMMQVHAAAKGCIGSEQLPMKSVVDTSGGTSGNEAELSSVKAHQPGWEGDGLGQSELEGNGGGASAPHSPLSSCLAFSLTAPGPGPLSVVGAAGTAMCTSVPMPVGTPSKVVPTLLSTPPKRVPTPGSTPSKGAPHASEPTPLSTPSKGVPHASVGAVLTVSRSAGIISSPSWSSPRSGAGGADWEVPETQIDSDFCAEGVKGQLKGQLLVLTGQPAREPLTQDHPVLTEDRMEEQARMVASLGRSAGLGQLKAKLSGGLRALKSDMAAFQAANPGYTSVPPSPHFSTR